MKSLASLWPVKNFAVSLTLTAHAKAQWRTALMALGLLAVFMAGLAAVQFAAPGIADNDGYYHIRLARLMREQGLKPAFVWLPLSILSREAFYDHHMLFHVYLALFAADDSPATLTLAAKLASVVMPALAFLAIWWLLRQQRVRWAGLWALGLFAMSEAFLYRMSMPRAQSASLLVLALGLHWLLQRRYWALAPLGFVYVWLYNAFPLLLMVAGVYAVAAFITERRVEWQALAYPALGLAAGLIINPYFPENITFIWQHLAPKLSDSATPVGNEWYPYQTWTLVKNSGPALGAFVLGMLTLNGRGRPVSRAALTAFLLAGVFGLMLFKSRRFVEYYPAFALIFLALSAAPVLEGWLTAKRRGWRWALVVSALLISASAMIVQGRAAMATSKPADLYADAAGWLRTHASPGNMVFQTDWDDFTRLFFYDTTHLYTIGLDPTYLELYDADLFDTWVKITQGKVKQPGEIIHQRFGAEYVFSDLKHGDFIRRAEADPMLKEVYRDQYAVIYQVIP